MDSYSVFVDVPYEGLSLVFSGSRDSIKEWVKCNRSYCLEDIHIYNDDAPDPFDLFREE